MGNLAGGRTAGVRWNGYLDFGVEVDLAKLGVWDGLGFHADFHWWQTDLVYPDRVGEVYSLTCNPERFAG